MSDIQKEKLAHCPFCGSEELRIITLELEPQRVKCADCGSQAYYDTWNTRPAASVTSLKEITKVVYSVQIGSMPL